MIGTIQIRCSAHNPSMPLCPVFAFQDSYQQVRISDVPKKIGDWSIKRVEVECHFPDNQTTSYECALVGGVWTTTIESCPTAGTIKNGFAVNGYDESSNKYILGKSDLYILTNDSRVIPQRGIDVVNILPSKPETPHVGDAVFVDGKLEIYDGENWISTGSEIEADDENPTWAKNTRWAKQAEFASNSYYSEVATDAINARNAIQADEAEHAGRADSVEWSNVQNKPSIPTKTSELSNDSNFVSARRTVDGYYNIDVNKAYMAETDVMGSPIRTTYATKNEVPTKTSQLENDSGFTKVVESDENAGFAKNADASLFADSAERAHYAETAESANSAYNATMATNAQNAYNVEWSNVQNKPSIPTKTSELSNDSEFVDKNFVNSSTAVKQDKLPYNDVWDVYDVGCWSAVNATRDVNGNWIDETYATKTEIPTKTSQLENDSITADSINAVKRGDGVVSGSLTVGIGENVSKVKIYSGDLENGAEILVEGGDNKGGTINVTGPDASIQINGIPILPDTSSKVLQLENNIAATLAALEARIKALEDKMDT